MRVRVVSAVAAAALTALSLPTSASASVTGPALGVDASAARHSISPLIYGMNRPDAGLASDIALPVDRWGGNTATRYNYANNTWNTGSDYYFENIVGSATDSLDTFVTRDKAARRSSVVTVPMLGYVAKASPSSHPFACGFPTARFPSQDSVDPWDLQCGNGNQGGSPLTGAVAGDTSTAAGPAFIARMVRHYVATYGTAAAGGVPIWELDNEPVLWNSTHRDVHPKPLTYAELASKSTAAAAAIKGVDPTAKTLGPSDWGWCAYFYSAADNCGGSPADHNAHGKDLAPWYLAQMKAYADAHGGVRTLDYFDEHYYPQASGVALSGAGDAATQAKRLRSVRSLWDPTYKDESWIGTDVGAPPIQLIRTMRSWVAANYPGTKTAMTEYNFGGLESINGALAQADVLGVFGRERLDLATLWSPPASTEPGAFAFRMYRNYDGAHSTFGQVGVRATTMNQAKISVYAAQRADGALTVMVINKTGAALTSPLTVKGYAAGSAVARYTYSGAHLGGIVHGANLRIARGTVTAAYPANSITLLVLHKAPVAASSAAATATAQAVVTSYDKQVFARLD